MYINESFWARHWSPWQLVITEGNGDFDRLSLFCDYSPRDRVMRYCNDVVNLLKQSISFIDEGQSSFYNVRAKIFILFFFFIFLLSTNLERIDGILVLVVVPGANSRVVCRHRTQTQAEVPQRPFHLLMGHTVLASGHR